MLYVENSKLAARKLLEIINEFGKVAGYKINIQKSCISTHSQKIPQKESKEIIPFTTISKRIKLIGINLYKEVKDLYSKKYKMLMKEIEEDSNK